MAWTWEDERLPDGTLVFVRRGEDDGEPEATQPVIDEAGEDLLDLS